MLALVLKIRFSRIVRYVHVWTSMVKKMKTFKCISIVNMTFAKGLTFYCACVWGSRFIHISVEYLPAVIELVSNTDRERPVAVSIFASFHHLLERSTGACS